MLSDALQHYDHEEGKPFLVVITTSVVIQAFKTPEQAWAFMAQLDQSDCDGIAVFNAETEEWIERQ
jgi:hypothetical protein